MQDRIPVSLAHCQLNMSAAHCLSGQAPLKGVKRRIGKAWHLSSGCLRFRTVPCFAGKQAWKGSRSSEGTTTFPSLHAWIIAEKGLEDSSRSSSWRLVEAQSECNYLRMQLTTLYLLLVVCAFHFIIAWVQCSCSSTLSLSPPWGLVERAKTCKSMCVESAHGGLSESGQCQQTKAGNLGRLRRHHASNRYP